MLGVKIFVFLLVMTTLMIPLLLNCKEKITSLLGMAKNGVFCFFFFQKSFQNLPVLLQKRTEVHLKATCLLR